MQKKTGILYVVATPIGNLQDITLRAIEILKQVNQIAAEDTRHAATLLKHFSINKPTISLHDFNERQRVKIIMDRLNLGEDIAIISDAGTPLISDPGFLLVREAKAQGIQVVPIPGASAAIAALSVAGLPTDRFIFEGFLPPKSAARRERLSTLLHEPRTMIFYEAPHRMLEALQDILHVFGPERIVVIARELTKVHESVLKDEIKNLVNYIETHPSEQRGEVVIIMAGSDEVADQSTFKASEVLAILLEELPLKQASALASKITGERKNVLYKMALEQKDVPSSD